MEGSNVLNSRIYGIIGVRSIMSNWNADFSGFPKSISTGEYFGSDKALKYTIRKAWESLNEKVLYTKTLKIGDDGKVRPKSLKERYEELFSVDDLKAQNSTAVLTNLFSAIDVKNFGATFAEEKNNISITGAVQITQGFNKYEDMIVEEQQILSPFRSENKKQKKDEVEAESSTLGTKIVANEAHYFYTFSINPKAYSEYMKINVTEGYTVEDYKKFKEAAICCATSFSTNSKVGCENEFAMFIECEENLYLPDLGNYLSFSKGVGEKDVINLEFADLVHDLKNRIKSIEIYYNPYKLEKPCLNNAKYYNIFTKEVI